MLSSLLTACSILHHFALAEILWHTVMDTCLALMLYYYRWRICGVANNIIEQVQLWASKHFHTKSSDTKIDLSEATQNVTLKYPGSSRAEALPVRHHSESWSLDLISANISAVKNLFRLIVLNLTARSHWKGVHEKSKPTNEDRVLTKPWVNSKLKNQQISIKLHATNLQPVHPR
jgi:hypothetical protein